MKKLFVTMFCLGMAAPLFADGTNQLADEKSRVSYAIGMMTGHQWKMQDLDFDPDVYARGIKDALAGGTTLLTPEETQQTIEAFKKEFTAKQQQKRTELAAKNKAEGEAFLATNKIKPGVKLLSVACRTANPNCNTSSSPTAPARCPTANDTVTVNYRGTLLDGTEFDSSYKRGQPAQLPGRRRHSRLDGGAGKNARRLEMEIVHPVRTRLRRTGPTAAFRRIPF